MSNRRSLKKEEEEHLQKQKTALKKSYQKKKLDSKHVGSKRFSDTKKYLIIGTVAGIIIVLITVQFLIPPQPLVYYTEADFVFATLDQDGQNITFNRIQAYYSLHPSHTSLNCNIVDYYNTSYSILPPVFPITPIIWGNEIEYFFANETSDLSWTTIMENSSTPLQMSTWLNFSSMLVTPSSVPRGIPTEVNFYLEIVTTTNVDHYNASLKIKDPIELTSVSTIGVYNGSYDADNFTFWTQGHNLVPGSSIVLNFSLIIDTSLLWSELNLLETGELQLRIKDTLLSDYQDYSAFKESIIDFSGLGLGPEPALRKSKFLNIVLNIPYYNVTIF